MLEKRERLGLFLLGHALKCRFIEIDGLLPVAVSVLQRRVYFKGEFVFRLRVDRV